MIRKHATFLVLFLILGAIAPLAADIRFELGFGWTLVRPSMDTTYVNRYQPPFTPVDRYIASSADQTVRFRAKTTYGLNGYFNVLFTESFGLQVLADYHRPQFGGANDPYEIGVQFQAFGPETYADSVDWQASTGNLTETVFSLNALARFRVDDKLSLSLSAGPSVFHFEGQAGHIGYTFFELAQVGDEFRLSGGTYRMVVDFGPQTKYGANFGVEAAYEAFRSVILAVDLRYYAAARTPLQLHVVEDELITRPIDEIEATIGLGTLDVNPSYLRAGLAIRFIF